jgi:drug/metabolite transporter (DMT)-like permease
VCSSDLVSFGAGTLRGDLAVLVAAMAWSVYTVGSVPLVHRYGVVPVTAATMWVGTAGLLIASLPALVGQDWAAVHTISWLAVLYSGAFAIATAYFLWYFCIRQIGSTRTAVYTNFTPVVALLVAWPALGEVPTALQAAGAGGIIAGSILVRAGKIERPQPGR